MSQMEFLLSKLLTADDGTQSHTSSRYPKQTPAEERERARLHGEILTPEWMLNDLLTTFDAW